jgi:NADH dehydrogenase
VILVAGGTGRLGTLVVSGLAGRGLKVRVLTRAPARASHLAGVAAEIVRGDVRDRPTIERAMAGVDTVVSAVQGFAGPGRVSPASVDRDGNAHLIDAAVGVDADVVLVSVVGARSDHPMELFRAKHQAEQHLQASGASWTVVRATAFVELWASVMAKPIVFGQGDNPINFVSVRDVAAVVERATIDTNLRGQILEVGGPENLTFNQLAVTLGELRGQPRKVWHVPRGMLRVMAPASRLARAAVAMDTTDMTFAPSTASCQVELAMTDIATALTHASATRSRPKS